MKKKLFIFSWSGVHCDYNCGDVHVIASNIADARAMIFASWNEVVPFDENGYQPDEDKNRRDVFTVLNEEPVIMEVAPGLVIDCNGSA